MDREKMIARHYLETGVLGAYETTEVEWDEVVDGKCAPCFEDATVFFGKNQTTTVRSMCIEGRRFRIRSVLPATGNTPTDKMLALIDAELKNGTHFA
ncbi:hypothetical protein [Lactonifactor longoviformis]|uniref:hypothetical protein n=1 Tax=Lactonifactor longoviformis TaxID=341220 RepID=UPI001D01B205|nr:hypothetical protein [Lactonifactor longoviformis]MCB5712392.1 hypothetical protein [Lactonifactor longoviformis]MCB5716436.1 hypothetical protein [Lactonifactor longoviformis]